jgi:hypothetical protein
VSRPIKEVKKDHERRLLAIPGVVSIGLGRDKAGNPAIIIGLDCPRPETERQLPTKLESYPVRIQVIGPIRVK